MELKLPPDWAIQKALDLGAALYDGLPKYLRTLEDVKRAPLSGANFRDIAFALYIEQHEEPPVDPALIRAREIYATAYGTPQVRLDILEGRHDNSSFFKILLRTLKETPPCS